MKKGFWITAFVLELLACTGAWLMQYFTARKMGMLRWVNGVCNKWSRSLNLDTLYAVVLVLLSMAALLLLLWALQKNRGPWLDALVCTTLGSVGAAAAVTVGYTRKLMAAYYLVCPLLFLGAAAALLCLALALGRTKE